MTRQASWPYCGLVARGPRRGDHSTAPDSLTHLFRLTSYIFLTLRFCRSFHRSRIIYGFLEANLPEHIERSTGGAVRLRGGILWREQDLGAQGRGGQLLGILETATLVGDATLEDADSVDLHFLAQSDEMAQGIAQFAEHGDTVALLDTGLGLDEVGQLVGTDMLLIIHCLGIVLAVTQLLILFKFLMVKIHVADSRVLHLTS